MDTHRGVLPPEEGMRKRRPVGYAHSRLEIGRVRGKHDTDGAARPVCRVAFGQPADRRTVRAPLDLVVNGHICGRTVVERPVELHTAGNPRAERADERGLDDVLPVEEVVVVDLVVGFKDPSAQLRQDADADVVVFEPDDGVVPVGAVRTVHLLHDSAWIRIAACTLVTAQLREHGHFLDSGYRIRRDRPDLRLRDNGMYVLHRVSSLSLVK